MIGFVQDSWRATDRLTLELGLRYDYYSVVKEAEGRARPFFVEDNAFGDRPGQFLRPGQEQLLAAPVGGVPAERQDGVARRLRPVLRPGPVRGSHPADRELHRAPARGRRGHSEQRPGVSGIPGVYQQPARRFAATRTSDRTSTTCSTAPASRASCRARSTSPSATPGSQGKDMFLRGVGEHARLQHARAAGAGVRPDRLQDGGLRRRLRDHRPGDHGLRPRHLQRAADQRDAPVPRRASPAAFSISTRATRARRRARTRRRRRRTRSTSRPNTARTRRTSRTRSTARWSI